AEYLTTTIIHELAHNWNGWIENELWGGWLVLSGWVPRTGSASPGPNQSISGNGAWFYYTSAPFAEEYSKWSPEEDWATTFEAYYQHKQGRLSASKAAELALKFAVIEGFINSKKG